MAREGAAPGAPPAAAWLLTLHLAGGGRLQALLGDGHWVNICAEAPWPPAGTQALPDATLQSLRDLNGPSLRLQLTTALDAWPWEREITAHNPTLRALPRYLTDLPPSPAPHAAATPLLATPPDGATPLALVQAARQQQRPLVVAGPALAAPQRQTLERSLRSLWREPLCLSEALALALAQLGLPADTCRLYGDGRAQLADTEQGLRPVTVLSIDVVSSTLLLRTLGAEAYAQRLQAYHARCREVILRFQGSLDTPQGDDGLMAYFGFPLAVEDAAARALTAAWQLATGMAALGLQVRVGVASGQVAVSAQQAFGPEVHLAARLCAAALPGQVLVAPSTQHRVGPGFELEALDEGLSLKDFGGLKDVYRLCGLHTGTGSPGLRHAGASGFVGRQHELQVLRQAWAAACEGRTQWCVLHGEAGIGKSRLLHEFMRELRARGQRGLTLAGQVQAGSSPFAAVVDALREHWAIDAQVDAAQLRQRLAGLPLPPRPDGDAGTDDLGDLARLLVLSGGEALPWGAGHQRRWSELLLDCLRALIEPGPFCLLVDDAHWLDPSTLELLHRLRDAAHDRPLLVLLGERSTAGQSSALPGTTRLELQGLAEAEAQALAHQLGAALPEQLRRHVVERAEGVPLYLEESLRMLSHRRAEASGEVPAKLEDLLMVRLDELGPDRALAQLVSVLGRECSALHLQALLDQDDPFVERARQQGRLESLLDNGLLQPVAGPTAGYRFKHALLRDAAYGSIWAHDRKRLHGLCADLMERSTPGLWQERPEHLAQHLEAAGRPGPAHRAWLAAAQLAATRHAHQESHGLAQRALALHEQLPDTAERARSAMQLQLLQASAQIALQGYGSAEVEAAYQAAEAASAQLDDAGHGLRIRLGLEACYVMRGDLPRAAALAQNAVAATAWTQDARLALQARWALANVHFHQGHWQAALAGFDDCLAHYQPALHRRSSVQDPAIMCLGYASWIHFELGQADEALRCIGRMLDLAGTLQHPFSTAVALGFAASIKRLCGDVEGAWPHAQEAVRICEHGGFQVWLAHAWMVRGQLRSDRGDTAGGADDMARGYALWVGSGARISCATYRVTQAELLLRQGRNAQAAAALGEAWHISQQIGEHYYQAELLRLQGLCAWQAGNPAQAEHLLRRALDLARAQGKPGLALRCTLSLGALQAAQGHWPAQAPQLRELLDTLPAHGSSRDLHWARLALQHWEDRRHFPSSEHSPWEPR